MNFNLNTTLTKTMPDNNRQHIPIALSVIIGIVLAAQITVIHAYEGINTYYIRYDVKSSANRIIDDNLLMVPSKNDFRAENFSQISTKGVISSPPGEASASIDNRIRDNCLKAILVKNGLKSIHAKDLDTVVSYEGVIITPLNILKKTYHENQNTYTYEARVEFSPMAFPDKWKTLAIKHRAKQVLNNFFQLFH